jgi:hypothetical protein
MRTIALSFSVALLLNACCLAEEKPAPVSVDKLVEQLRSDDFEQREKAQTLLSEGGAPARAALEKALKEPRVEADFATRAKRILEILDADNHLGRFDTIKRVDLQVKNTLREALDQLKADFKCQIATDGDNENFDKTPVDVNVKNATFFEALEAIRISAKAGYSQNYNANTFPLSLSPLPEKTLCPTALSGQFMFVAQNVETNIERTLSFDQEKPSTNQRLSVSGVLVGAPGIRLAGIGLHEMILSDNTPDSYDPTFSVSAHALPESPVGESLIRISINTDFQQALKAPLALKFSAVAVIPVRVEEKTYALTAPETAVAVSGDVTLKLKPAEKRDKRGWEIPFTANCNSSQLMQSSDRRSRKVKKKVKEANEDNDNNEQEIDESIVASHDAVCSPGIYVIDAEGKKYQASFNMGGGGTQASCNGRIFSSTEPKSILVRSVTEKAERSVPLELKNLPLP